MNSDNRRLSSTGICEDRGWFQAVVSGSRRTDKMNRDKMNRPNNMTVYVPRLHQRELEAATGTELKWSGTQARSKLGRSSTPVASFAGRLRARSLSLNLL